MSGIISDLNLKHFNDGRFIFVGGLIRLMGKYGWYRGDALEKWIGKLIEDKTLNSEITFLDLHKMSIKKGFKDLYITGTNLSKQRAEVFSYETYPNMKIKDAVRISVSIPFYFKPVLIDSIGNVNKKKKNKDNYDLFVDGGITQNFPIHLFDKEKYLADTTSLSQIYNPKTLGLRLDSDLQIMYDAKNNPCPRSRPASVSYEEHLVPSCLLKSMSNYI